MFCPVRSVPPNSAGISAWLQHTHRKRSTSVLV